MNVGFDRGTYSLVFKQLPQLCAIMKSNLAAFVDLRNGREHIQRPFALSAPGSNRVTAHAQHTLVWIQTIEKRSVSNPR